MSVIRTVRSQRGFTLLEVLVALVILAIALAAVIKVSGQSAQMLDRLRADTAATLIAQDLCTRLQLAEQAPTPWHKNERSADRRPALAGASNGQCRSVAGCAESHLSRAHARALRRAGQHRDVLLSSCGDQVVRASRGMQAGFTLLELLVAIAIFSLVAVMAYGGLNTVITQGGIVQSQTRATGSDPDWFAPPAGRSRFCGGSTGTGCLGRSNPCVYGWRADAVQFDPDGGGQPLGRHRVRSWRG